jgi:hypothetical protein
MAHDIPSTCSNWSAGDAHASVFWDSSPLAKSAEGANRGVPEDTRDA